jgi:hypothetical protein
VTVRIERGARASVYRVDVEGVTRADAAARAASLAAAAARRAGARVRVLGVDLVTEEERSIDAPWRRG